MCVFIELAVAGFRGDACLPFRQRKLVAEALGGESGVPMLAEGTRLSVTDGHCACTLYVGNTPQAELDLEGERRRYQRKGWSKSKIDRAIEAKRTAHARPTRNGDLAESFVEAIQVLALEGARLTLLASDSDSSFHVSGSARMSLDDFVSSGGMFPQNTLVSIG